ncbi:putative leucine-rich repeat-containing protein DDB_G0290503 [Palaemon carinicauda]|uniref:putative leucine-rich repeat-containing protein DDB_G0290503 n=1 Tax=Palaemon carinicauda TaxID=392227 RepID=UPI0035B685F6
MKEQWRKAAEDLEIRVQKECNEKEQLKKDLDLEKYANGLLLEETKKAWEQIIKMNHRLPTYMKFDKSNVKFHQLEQQLRRVEDDNELNKYRIQELQQENNNLKLKVEEKIKENFYINANLQAVLREKKMDEDDLMALKIKNEKANEQICHLQSFIDKMQKKQESMICEEKKFKKEAELAADQIRQCNIMNENLKRRVQNLEGCIETKQYEVDGLKCELFNKNSELELRNNNLEAKKEQLKEADSKMERMQCTIHDLQIKLQKECHLKDFIRSEMGILLAAYGHLKQRNSVIETQLLMLIAGHNHLGIELENLDFNLCNVKNMGQFHEISRTEAMQEKSSKADRKSDEGTLKWSLKYGHRLSKRLRDNKGTWTAMNEEDSENWDMMPDNPLAYLESGENKKDTEY